MTKIAAAQDTSGDKDLKLSRIEGRQHLVDVEVGQRIRARREQMGLSQGYLAENVGVSFQQIQKYERGANRVSASMLFDIAGVLSVAPAYFFATLPDPAGGPPSERDLAIDENGRFAATPEGGRLIEAYRAAPKELRLLVANLLAAISRREGDQRQSPAAARF
jgi:transcriptional regulator with XRE-family HTH domain